MTRDLVEIGTTPALGEVPRRMHAWTLRRERYGEPLQSMQMEIVPVPEPGPDDVLVYVMAAGVNFNNVWAGRGFPLDVIAARERRGDLTPFHVGGSDAAGIVYRVGRDVRDVKVGDEVVLGGVQVDRNCPRILAGDDPLFSPTIRIWGYETNFGAFAQFTVVKEYQCFAKPTRLEWDEASVYLATGASAYRMLHGWGEHAVREGDVVLVWGAAGGLGSYALQLAREARALPVAVVSSGDRAEFCRKSGAVGCIDRTKFDHWGPLPHWTDVTAQRRWHEQAKAFGRALWDALGEPRNPRLVIEHPGESTLPTSMFVCETGGMVVICAGTTGFSATLDLRYLWMRQKRLQGSHAANRTQADALNQLVQEGRILPVLSRSFPWTDLARAHQLIAENRHPPGNMAVRVGAAG